MPLAQNDVGGKQIAAAALNNYLCRVTRRLVLDQAGLEGDDNSTLDWTATAENPVGNLLSVLPEQLGLKRHPQTAGLSTTAQKRGKTSNLPDEPDHRRHYVTECDRGDHPSSQSQFSSNHQCHAVGLQVSPLNPQPFPCESSRELCSHLAVQPRGWS